MAFVKITDTKQSWELLNAGLLWYKNYHGEYAPYSPALVRSWQRARCYWGAYNGDTIPDEKYILLED